MATVGVKGLMLSV